MLARVRLGPTAGSSRHAVVVSAPWSGWLWGILLQSAVLTMTGISTGCGGAAAQQERERRAAATESSAGELERKGELAASAGDMTRAEQYFAAALAKGGNEKRLVQRLLVVCVADERYPVALRYADEYLDRHPLDVDVTFASASIHAAIGHVEKARQLLETVVRKRPNWAEAHFALATVLREQGEALDLADVHDLKCLRLDPQGPLAERARARLTRATP